MKHFISAVTLLLCIFFSSRASALGNIDHMENLSGVTITQAAIGQEFYVIGSDFGNNQSNKNIVIDCPTPVGGFFMELLINEWTDTRIKAQIPRFTSNAYRENLYYSAGPFPDAIKEYMAENSVDGRLKMIREGSLVVLTNVVDFTVTPPPEITVYRPPVVGRPMEQPPKFEAKREPATVVMQPDTPEITAAPQPPVELKLPSDQVEVTAMPPKLEAILFPYYRCEALNEVPTPTFTSSVYCYFRPKPKVESIKPVYGPPGTYVEIKGSCFGRTYDGNNVWIDIPGSESRQMEIVSWTGNRIVTRVPAPDSIVMAGGEGYAVSTETVYEKSTVPVESTIEVRIGGFLLTPQEFTLTPYEPNIYPILCELDRRSADPGGWIVIYGSEFGTRVTGGRVFCEREGVTTEITEMAWSSAAIAIRLPSHIENGEYELYISRPDGRGVMRESNRLKFVVPAIMAPRFER